MKPIPDDPMRAHDRMIAAFCDDLRDICLNGGKGTPRTDAVCEIILQSTRGTVQLHKREVSEQ